MPKPTEILRLTIFREGFYLIAINQKKEEFREIKPYWKQRLYRKYKEVWFTNGYGKTRPFMRVECAGIYRDRRDIGEGMIEYFVIQLGEVLEIKNWGTEK